jgi:predicted transposase/invertase (TIGR01784 family)
MVKVAPLKYGVIFKKAFSKPKIFTAFVKDMLGIDIEIDKVETEKSFSPVIGKVDTKFDLFAEDKKNRIIVDIQHKRYSDHYDRFLHYHSIALIEQIKNFYSYTTPMKVYTIVVLTSGDKHKKDVTITDFRPMDLEGNYISETPHKILYLCPKYLNDKTPKIYREWLMAIEDSMDKEMNRDDYRKKVIQDIINIIETDSVTPQERAKMIQEFSDEEYLMKMKEKSKKEGRKEGREEGEKRAKIEIAKTALKQNIDIATIALITGLSVEEIKS